MGKAKQNTIKSHTASAQRQSDHSGPGGNWPSKTPNPSGGGRGNAK